MKIWYTVVFVLTCLALCPPLVHADNSLGRAQMDVKTVEKAVVAYKKKVGQWPASLDELTRRQDNGMPAYLESAAIIDPWNRPYPMDTQRLNPNSGVPLIWTDAPPPDVGKGKIVNWSLDGSDVYVSPFGQTQDEQALLFSAAIGLLFGFIGVGFALMTQADNGKRVPSLRMLALDAAVFLLCSLVPTAFAFLTMPRFID